MSDWFGGEITFIKENEYYKLHKITNVILFYYFQIITISSFRLTSNNKANHSEVSCLVGDLKIGPLRIIGLKIDLLQTGVEIGTVQSRIRNKT